MAVVYALSFLFVLQIITSVTKSQDITCLDCRDVESPAHCRDTYICGKGEICYTEEFQDHIGRQAFRLGCANQARCNLFLNAQTLFGKRDAPNPAPSDTCYQCCSSDKCNGALCKDSLGHFPGSQPSTHPSAGNGDDCSDRVDCSSYDIRTSCCGQFEAWSRLNCRKSCRFCTPKVTEAPLCSDTITNCDQYQEEMCTKVDFEKFVQKHCAGFCKVCEKPVFIPDCAKGAQSRSILQNI